MENLSDRVKFILKKQGITQAQLARDSGVTPQNVQFLYSKAAHKSKFTETIADTLGINAHWLATGRGAIAGDINDGKRPQFAVPIIDWTSVKSFLALEQGALPEEASLLYTDLKLRDKGIALNMNDASMQPAFDSNTLLIFERTEKAIDKSIVLTYVDACDNFFIRQLKSTKKTSTLAPLNTDLYKEFPLSPKDQIVGVLRETRMRYL